MFSTTSFLELAQAQDNALIGLEQNDKNKENVKYMYECKVATISF
jgi:hypothetical protein